MSEGKLLLLSHVQRLARVRLEGQLGTALQITGAPLASAPEHCPVLRGLT